MHTYQSSSNLLQTNYSNQWHAAGETKKISILTSPRNIAERMTEKKGSIALMV